MIISLLNQKGGVGKTTLAVHLAGELALRGSAVLMIDADPQASALDWANARAGDPLFQVVGIPRPNIHKEIAGHAQHFDHIVIDGAPRVNDLARSAILASDLVLIPVTPSPYDVWAAQEIVDLVNEASVYKENLKSAFVLNRKITNTAIGRGTIEALGDFDIQALPRHVSARVAFAESAAAGMVAQEIDPDGKAAREIRKLTDAVLDLESAPATSKPKLESTP